MKDIALPDLKRSTANITKRIKIMGMRTKYLHLIISMATDCLMGKVTWPTFVKNLEAITENLKSL